MNNKNLSFSGTTNSKNIIKEIHKMRQQEVEEYKNLHKGLLNNENNKSFNHNEEFIPKRKYSYKELGDIVDNFQIKNIPKNEFRFQNKNHKNWHNEDSYSYNEDSVLQKEKLKYDITKFNTEKRQWEKEMESQLQTMEIEKYHLEEIKKEISKEKEILKHFEKTLEEEKQELDEQKDELLKTIEIQAYKLQNDEEELKKEKQELDEQKDELLKTVEIQAYKLQNEKEEIKKEKEQLQFEKDKFENTLEFNKQMYIEELKKNQHNMENNDKLEKLYDNSNWVNNFNDDEADIDFLNEKSILWEKDFSSTLSNKENKISDKLYNIEKNNKEIQNNLKKVINSLYD